jgi:hypothetical protein
MLHLLIGLFFVMGAYHGLAGHFARIDLSEPELLFHIGSFDGPGLFAARIEQFHQSFVVPREFDFTIEVIDLGIE